MNMNWNIITNQTKLLFKFCLSSFCLAVLLIAGQVNAARVYFDPSPISYKVGDEFTLSLFLDTEKESVNAVEINILVPELLKIKDISKKGSMIQLWVQEPGFSGKIITLTGGIPGGFTASKGLIAKISFQAAAIGEGNITFMSNSVILLNDGQGTKLDLKTAGGPSFRVVPRAKESAVVSPESKKAPAKGEEDKDIEKENNKKPEKFEILIGEDPRVFNGQKFISFFTTDTDLGVEYYEVKEGGGDYRVAQSPYLLTDQELKTVIRVRAYGGAGNYTESIYPNLFKRIWWQLLRTLSFWK